VGGRAMVDSMQRAGRLADGTPITYAYGLTVDRFRGLRRVQHGGAWAGYRAMTMRFPDQRASILLTCNAANANTMRLAEGVATALLGPSLGPTDAERLRDSLATPPRATVAAVQGLWWEPAAGAVLRIAAQDSIATLASALGGPARPLAALPDGWLVATPLTEGATRYRFDAGTGRLTLRTGGGVTIPLERVLPAEPAEAGRRAAYVGRYENAEVPGTWTVELRRDSLWMVPPFGQAAPMQPVFRDAYSAGGLIVRFERDARGAPVALSLTTRGIRAGRWTRVADARP
jgi:hypothetical protein